MDTFVLVTWPESQLILEEDWIDECILMNDENHLDSYGSSAYFVPTYRYKELMTNVD